MPSVRVWAFAGAALLAATAANAAEPPVQPPPPPPPPPVLQPICVPRAQAYLWPGVPICAEEEFFASWYLRGDIGITNQKVSKIENMLITSDAETVNSEFDSAGLFGLGVGFNFNQWLRMDFTGEYRSASDYKGLMVVGGNTTNEIEFKKKEWLFLFNAYLDLGTWWCVTPFVGAGLGFSRVEISSFTDVCTTCGPTGSVSYASTGAQWNFAWALHAGLAFQATNNLAFEFAYRYVSLGDGFAGDVITYNGVNDFNNPTTFKDITSHDFKFGVRWTCCEEAAPPPPPPVYAPQPVYQPQLYVPPVMRKG
jgi:opacity protein-like surface antigen